MQSMKLTWLIIDDTPLGTDAHICDFLCVQVLRPLCALLSASRMKVGMALSPSLLQFLAEEEEDLFSTFSSFIEEGIVELVLTLSFPTNALSSTSIRALLEERNRMYQRFFQTSSRVLLPFGFSYEHELLTTAIELGFTQIVMNKNSMDASAGVVQHRCVSMHSLGVDPLLSHYSEYGSAKDFFIQLRNVAKEHGSAVCCSFLHNIGLKIGSFERCWNKGLMKTIVDGLQRAQKWLKVVSPSAHLRNKPVFPLVGYFPLNAKNVSSWKRSFYNNPELAVMWNQLQYLETELREPHLQHSLLELQEGSAFAPYPNGRLEDMQLRYLIWFGISQLREDCIVLAGECVDRDGDGIQELYFRSSIGDGACIPALGGMLTMLLIPGVGNVANVLTRRKWPWHDELAEDPRLPALQSSSYRTGLIPQSTYFYNKLGYDDHHRGIFSDVLYAQNVRLSQIRKGQARILCNLTNVEYKVLDLEDEEHTLKYDIEAQVLLGNQSLTIQKYYTFSHMERRITVRYTVENNSLEPVSFLWGTEINVGLQGTEFYYLYLQVD